MEVWATSFPDRKPEHFVFASKLYGLFGDEGYINGRAEPYSVDPTKPMGSWKTAWDTARKSAGVKCASHDLRHTCVTRLIENGVPITMVEKLVGWSANSMIAMATRYSHHGGDSLRRAMEAAGNAKSSYLAVGRKIWYPMDGVDVWLQANLRQTSDYDTAKAEREMALSLQTRRSGVQRNDRLGRHRTKRDPSEAA